MGEERSARFRLTTADFVSRGTDFSSIAPRELHLIKFPDLAQGLPLTPQKINLLTQSRRRTDVFTKLITSTIMASVIRKSRHADPRRS